MVKNGEERRSMFVNERRNIKRLFYGIWSVVVLLGIATLSFGQQTATLISDKNEYYFDEIAIFEGSNFDGNEEVTIQIKSINDESQAQEGSIQMKTIASGEKVRADGSGKIQFTWKACACGISRHMVTTKGNNSSKEASKEVKVNPQCGSCVNSLKEANIPMPDNNPKVIVDGVATIGNDLEEDGSPEWETSDLFAHMYIGGIAGDNRKTSDAYVVFYCNPEKTQARVSVLVKALPPYTIVQDAPECGKDNWIKYCVDGKAEKLVDSCDAANFKYVVEDGQTVGYEAWFTIPPGDYKVLIHAEVTKDGGATSETSAVEGHPAGVCMLIDCDQGGETAVELASFTAGSVGGGKVALTWETATEVNNAGFNLYRSRLLDGIYKKINEGLIPARDNAATGASYRYEDSPGRGTFYYKLEDVDRNGVTTMHGPEKVRVRSTDRDARRSKGQKNK
ncbi:MAG: hypothetical protein E3K40_01490 [Candidatus Brocadia sp.]|nr:hypothetical protein [Candidatus Brocadia sp.]